MEKFGEPHAVLPEIVESFSHGEPHIQRRWIFIRPGIASLATPEAVPILQILSTALRESVCRAWKGSHPPQFDPAEAAPKLSGQIIAGPSLYQH